MAFWLLKLAIVLFLEKRLWREEFSDSKIHFEGTKLGFFDFGILVLASWTSSCLGDYFGTKDVFILILKHFPDRINIFVSYKTISTIGFKALMVGGQQETPQIAILSEILSEFRQGHLNGNPPYEYFGSFEI